MPKEKNKKTAIVFWILTALVMAIIFFLSARNADESSNQSNWLLTFLNSLLGREILTDFIIRKAAHFLEYTLLCFLFNWSFYFTYESPKRLLSLVLTSLYAASDEIHQLFVEGRSCELRDWAIDTSGAVLGLIAFCVLFLIIKKILTDKIESNNIV